MDKVLAECLPLDSALLTSDEESYDKQAQSLVAKLSKLTAQELAFKDALDSLDPTIQTIPYLYVLVANIDEAVAGGKAVGRKLPDAMLPEGVLWPYITRILLDFDPIQVRYSGELLTRVAGVVTLGAEQTQNFIPAIQILQSVILRLDTSSTTFTTTHYAFIRLCTIAQAYTEALTILDRPIYHIPASLDRPTETRAYKYLCSVHDSSAVYLTPNTGLTQVITSRIYLEYYLLGAMCYMATRQYAKALFFLQVVITAPSQQNHASFLMVDAYKKWLLLSLLVSGNPPTLPKSINQTALRHIKAIAKAYECIVDAFKGPSMQRLRAEIEAGMQIWQEDLNYGLIVEVFQAYRKFSILRLGQTFAAMSIVDVAKRTSPEPNDINETLAYVQSLIAGGDLNATIVPSPNSSDQTLRFLSTTTIQKTEAQVENELAQSTIELNFILKQIHDLDHRMEISREYVDWLKKLKKVKDEDKKSNGQRGSAAFIDDVDEDMMEEF